ncbi:MAG TPA: TM0106 family RecB-like putative nuclease [Acidimicrobiales bacterium]|nr:TM0106 family RecB-like putative nuclease [Acidimicrobiales bacterium]
METVEIAPRWSSFAKACPEQVQLDVLQPCEPLPTSPFLEKLFQAGHDYEDETVDSLFEGIEGAVVVKGDDPDAREYHTLRAAAAGAPVIAGGRLPVDHETHRVGEPDLLVRHGDGYLPVDVKSHKSLERVRKEGSGTALVSELETPFFDAAVTDTEHNPRKHVGDQLQLAHYRVLLDAAGLACPGSYAAGILGTEGVIVWYDLERRWLDPPEYVEHPPQGPMSAMGRYEVEFQHRLDVYRAAEAHRRDGSVPLVAEPILCDQCDLCRWRDWCGDKLEEAADLSLISGIGAGKRRLYKAQGIDDLHALAALDWRTAELHRCKVDLDDVVHKAVAHAPTTPLSEVIPGRTKQVEALTAHGLHTVADLELLDRVTLDCCLEAVAGAAPHIELARARVGAAPAYRKRGVDEVVVPRGDVEVDVDMENTNDGCYLWGALVVDRRLADSSAQYVPFASWDPDIAAGELVAFAEFWRWLTDLRARTAAAGATFRAYCYSKSAEQGQMTRLADELGLRGEVDEFLASEDWVDLLEVMRAQLVTGRSMSLKETAPLAGFAWRTNDGGGTMAMVEYDQAIDDADPAGAAEARRWLLEYNEDDVRATAALRWWLDGEAKQLPSIADAQV